MYSKLISIIICYLSLSLSISSLNYAYPIEEKFMIEKRLFNKRSDNLEGKFSRSMEKYSDTCFQDNFRFLRKCTPNFVSNCTCSR